MVEIGVTLTTTEPRHLWQPWSCSLSAIDYHSVNTSSHTITAPRTLLYCCLSTVSAVPHPQPRRSTTSLNHTSLISGLALNLDLWCNRGHTLSERLPSPSRRNGFTLHKSNQAQYVHSSSQTTGFGHAPPRCCFQERCFFAGSCEPHPRPQLDAHHKWHWCGKDTICAIWRQWCSCLRACCCTEARRALHPQQRCVAGGHKRRGSQGGAGSISS